jgi:hypothetical protein
MMVSKSALADDSVISTRLEIGEFLYFNCDYRVFLRRLTSFDIAEHL